MHRSLARRGERGQAILEFAVVMPILFLLLFAVVFFAMAFNLQMILNAAAREGARRWASNRADTSPCCATCTSPCDPTFGDSGFQKNVVPVIKKYISDNGYDAENNLIFETVEVTKSELSLAEWNDKETSIEDATKVKLVISYQYFLPTPAFEIQLVHLRAEYTFKRGS
ncbi:MAG TPA: TadE family protein [Blastocatellia bacterium]|nr:TadE family protein [Blastocatellia bacterium]